MANTTIKKVTPTDIGSLGIKSYPITGTTNNGGGLNIGTIGAASKFISAVSNIGDIIFLYLGNQHILAVNNRLELLPNTQVSGTIYYHD